MSWQLSEYPGASALGFFFCAWDSSGQVCCDLRMFVCRCGCDEGVVGFVDDFAVEDRHLAFDVFEFFRRDGVEV